MAKLKNQETVGAEEIIPVAETGDNIIPEKTKEKPKTKEPPQTIIPSFVDTILKSFKAYESLYVDMQGGVYTPDTAPAIRKQAILYKNPYYKPSNA